MKTALAALALVFLAAHLWFLPPTLEDIDSVNFALAVGDFDVARHQPHPPGYPVYVALSKISTAAFGGAGDRRAVVRGLAVWSAIAGAALVFLLFALFRALDLPAEAGSHRTAGNLGLFRGVDLPGEAGSQRTAGNSGMLRGVDLPAEAGSHETVWNETVWNETVWNETVWNAWLPPSGGRSTARAWWAMAIAVASPLFWFTALRPLSDMTGLAAATAAQALILAAANSAGPRAGRLLVAGGFVAGLAAGVRVQTAALTAPLLLGVLLWPRRDLTARMRLAASGAACAGVAAWGVPLLAASGGLGGYLAALGSQAGEDFSGVVMLWTTRSARVALNAVLYSFVWPWGGLAAGAVVLALAVGGTVRLLLRAPRAILWLALAFGPYAVFHLLFHETATVRYALPLVVPVAYLAAAAIEPLGRRAAAIAGTALVAVLLIQGLGAMRMFGAHEAPAFQAAREAVAGAGGGPLGMHAVFRRTAEWLAPDSQVLRAPHGAEWMTLVERWRAEPAAPIVFLSDPRRTDLALFDPHARELEGSYRWPFSEVPYVGGIRPGNADWYLMRPPGWMLDRGWALSAEIGGVAARDAAGPHLRPSVAWIRARPGAALLAIGGRNLHAQATSRLTVSLGSRALDAWELKPGFFFRLIPIPAGALGGGGYVPLSVTAEPARSVPVSLEQFDVQPDGVPMSGFMEGWQEPEYNPATSRAWRWISEKSVLWVRPVGREVTLTLSGESTLRYFDTAPAVTVRVGTVEVDRFSPSEDFTREIRLPAAALDATAGQVTIESDRWFVPAERGESADPRRLALRIYGVGVR